MSIDNHSPTVTPIPLSGGLHLRDLRAYPQWVCFTPDKQPINPKTGYGAKANDPTTWASVEEALRLWRSQPTKYAGMGFEFVKEQALTGIDLDKCIDEQGQISPYAREVVARINSYTEKSPSQRGLHIWAKGAIPSALAPFLDVPDIRIEMYDHERYFTITGDHLPGTPETIEDRQDVLLALHAEETARRRAAKEAKRSGHVIPSTSSAPVTPRPGGITNGDSAYGLAALTDECHDLATTGNGSRNSRLNAAAYNMGRLIGGNELTRSTVEQALFSAAERAGLGEIEISKTMKSGLEAGIQEPRTRPVDDIIYGTPRSNNGGSGEDNGPGQKAAGDQQEPDTKFVIECLREGEYGDSLLFALLFKGQTLYDHTGDNWYTWKGHYWEKDRTGKIKHLVSGKLASCYLKAGASLNVQASQQEAKAELSGDDQEKAAAKERVTFIKKLIKELTDRAFTLRQVARCKNILYFAQSHEGMGIIADQWDRNNWLLAVPNGVIDLRTGILRDGKPEDYIRTAAPTVWKGLQEPAPRWERFLQEIFEDRPPALRKELIDFKQRLMGYGITGESVEHIFAILYGEDGRNGKDTEQHTMSHVLGGASGAVHKDVFLAADRSHAAGAPNPHLLSLQGKRLAWANEPDTGSRFNTAQIKDLTGGGVIPARGPFEREYTNFNPTHLLLLLTNHRPHANANDPAFWTRMVMFVYNMRFVEHPTQGNERLKDTSLWGTLENEAPGILAWLVKGCLEWQRIGLCIPDQVKQAVTDYREEEDDLRTFLEECCVLKEGLTVKASALYEAYEKWAKAGNIYVLNKTQFGIQMTKKKFEKKKDGYIKYVGIGISDGHLTQNIG